jgi:hypothetical protein
MAKLTVSVAGVDYDRTRALFDGTVPIAGCETICCAMSPEEAFHRAFRYQEFDITELSLSNSMALVAKGRTPMSLFRCSRRGCFAIRRSIFAPIAASNARRICAAR